MLTSWLRLVVPAALLAGMCAVPAGAADEPPTRKELATSKKNLKQIGLAIHNFCGANDDKFPDDITDKDGTPLLSWRVAILPFLEEQKLWEQFKFDEPWDSANNKKLIEKMPKLYAPVRVKAKTGETFYQRFVGKDALFNEKGTDYTIGTIPDGTSNTALVVEAGDPVIWSKPADLTFGAKRPLPHLGGLFDGDFHVVMCDGSVMRVKKDFDADEMKRVVMPADGNVIDFKKLTK